MGVHVQLKTASNETDDLRYDPAVDRVSVYELLTMTPERRRIILERQVEYVLQDEYEILEANEVLDYPETEE